MEQNIQSRLFSNYSYRVIRKVTKHFQTVYNRWKGVRTPQNLPLICNRPDFSFLVFSSISSLPLHPGVVLGPARSLGSEIFLLNFGKSNSTNKKTSAYSYRYFTTYIDPKLAVTDLKSFSSVTSPVDALVLILCFLL